jgi:hypothetical protein
MRNMTTNEQILVGGGDGIPYPGSTPRDQAEEAWLWWLRTHPLQAQPGEPVITVSEVPNYWSGD